MAEGLPKVKIESEFENVSRVEELASKIVAWLNSGESRLRLTYRRRVKSWDKVDEEEKTHGELDDRERQVKVEVDR